MAFFWQQVFWTRAIQCILWWHNIQRQLLYYMYCRHFVDDVLYCGVFWQHAIWRHSIWKCFVHDMLLYDGVWFTVCYTMHLFWQHTVLYYALTAYYNMAFWPQVVSWLWHFCYCILYYNFFLHILNYDTFFIKYDTFWWHIMTYFCTMTPHTHHIFHNIVCLKKVSYCITNYKNYNYK